MKSTKHLQMHYKHIFRHPLLHNIIANYFLLYPYHLHISVSQTDRWHTYPKCATYLYKITFCQVTYAYFASFSTSVSFSTLIIFSAILFFMSSETSKPFAASFKASLIFLPNLSMLISPFFHTIYKLCNLMFTIRANRQK